MTPVVAGDMSNQDVWKKFIQAFNDENLEIMSELVADDIEIHGSRGGVIKGYKRRYIIIVFFTIIFLQLDLSVH
ncbi:MAG: hypothetical protein O2814_07970 [Bacteroidetes bacterium]|nr:hypothetical protein [Bacteroidota bacterium]MDA1224744.1 hypothetical protein [Bacteroidota bacterium]